MARIPQPGEPCPICERPMPKLTLSQRLKLAARNEAAQDRKRKAKARAKERWREKNRARTLEQFKEWGVPIPDDLVEP